MNPYQVPLGPITMARDDQWYSFVDDEEYLWGVGGLTNQRALPTGYANLVLHVRPSETQWQVGRYVTALVQVAFRETAVTTIRMDIPRDTDRPDRFEVWQRIADAVPRALGAVVAVGGWWFEAEGNQPPDADKSRVLHLHWVKG